MVPGVLSATPGMLGLHRFEVSKSSKFIFFYLKPGCAPTYLVTINCCPLWLLRICLLVIKGNNAIYRGLLTSDTFMITVMLTGEDIYFDVWFIITHVNKPPHPPSYIFHERNVGVVHQKVYTLILIVRAQKKPPLIKLKKGVGGSGSTVGKETNKQI